ncbi:MAG: dienelactone hydrolase family protein [Devosia sp.]
MTRRNGAAAPAPMAWAFGRMAVLLICALLLAPWNAPVRAQTAQPRTVSFPSADGKTTLVGYLFAPDGRPRTAPAVILLHGRNGAYSARAHGNYSSVTLEKKLRSWAELWSAQGYWALIVDSYGPRGYPQGFATGGDLARVPAVSEVDVRPLDAYGALRYLKSSPRIRPDRIALQGWANGGSAALASVAPDSLAWAGADLDRGFRMAVALYPDCVLEDKYKGGYKPFAPVHILVGARDEEEAACNALAGSSKAEGGNTALTVLAGATHDFDDPERSRAQTPANAAASAEARRLVTGYLASVLR